MQERGIRHEALDTETIKNGKKHGLPSSETISWDKTYEKLKQDLNLSHYREFDAQIITNFLLSCENKKLKFKKFGYYNEYIIPEDALNPSFIEPGYVEPQFQPNNMTIEQKRDVLLREFYPEIYFEYRKSLPIYNMALRNISNPIKYPNQVEVDRFCFKCREVLQVISKHFPTIYSKYAAKRSVRPNSFLINAKADKTRLKNLENRYRKPEQEQ
jgi:hypothetical protein